jgi:tRNA A-37 threonylcarbamoyl transferase component Bud32
MNFPIVPLTHLVAGGFRWSLAPDLHHVLLGPAGLRLPEWIEAGQAHVIKHGPHRVVYRVDLPGLSFYLKHNLIPDRLALLRQLIRRSKARMEYESTLAVAARGVPTISPLALGEQQCLWSAGESYLITRSLEDSQPLNIFLAAMLPALPAGRRTAVRQRLATALGQLVARIHDAGVLHNDLHAANLLVRLGEHDQVALYVIDLNAVRIGAPLDWEASRRNLVMLNSWFVPRVSRSDRLRFWKAYFEARQLGIWQRGAFGPKLHAQLAQEIEKRTWRFNLRFWRRRDRRCLKINRYYQPVRGPGVVGHAVTELDQDELRQLLADPDAVLRLPGVRLLKDSVSSTVAELQMMVDGRLRSVIYKRFRVTSWTDPFTSLLRQPPALRSWVHGQGFRERGLPTARPLAFFHRSRHGLWYEGYLLTEKIEHAAELHQYLRDLEALPPAERLHRLHRQIGEVARTIRAMHRRRLSHRDLKAANILVRRWDAPASAPDEIHPSAVRNLLHMPEGTVWLIDLVGVELFRRLKRRRRVQNLARLNASFHANSLLTRTDRLRFLRTYLNWGIHGRGNWKAWWRRIAQATRDKVQRNRRRGRPLG